MRRILIAGGAGHIGSHLCEAHLERGDEVVCVDDFSTSDRANISHFEERLTIVDQDVTEPLELEADRIYNLACPAAPIHYQRDPVRTFRCSVIGSLNLLELARRCNARILLASTSEIYGDPQVHPQPESYRGNVNTIGPRACYNEGKRAAETLFADYRRQHGVDTAIARIFNTYGPRMRRDDGRVVPAFILRALAGDPLELHGEGEQTRSFCFVDDMVDGLVRLMDSGIEGPINIGNPLEISVRQLAETILEITDGCSPLVNGPRPTDDPARRCPDLTLARERLGWQPQVSLREGLAKTAEWFKRE
ncbi:MAG: UDP-glucuronic acid decarboxylase family protein [Planctomycetota bacterium]|jgi:UDP-glucuronate decarboxylase